MQQTSPHAEPKLSRGALGAARLVSMGVLTFAGVYVGAKLHASREREAASLALPASVAALAASAPPTDTTEAVLGGVVELRPRGPRVNLASAIEVDFSAPVDRVSVEAALESVPPIEWRTSWPKPTLLRLTPRAPLKSGTLYRLRVAGRLAHGVPLEPFAGEFRTEVPAPKDVVKGRGGNLVLTFDDGPRGSVRTRRLLELLEQYHVKALFFPVAQNLVRYPNWIRDVEAKGHRVCNHSYTHPNLASRIVSDEGVRREIEKGAGFGRCRLFRPPMMAHDERSDRVARELGYSVFLWDIDTRDWEEIPADEIYNRVLRAVEPGRVVLFHLQARRTLRALRGLLPRLIREGYVLSWDPRDVDQAARERFGVGTAATWLGPKDAARARWVAAFTSPAATDPWPFPVGETEPRPTTGAP